MRAVGGALWGRTGEACRPEARQGETLRATIAGPRMISVGLDADLTRDLTKFSLVFAPPSFLLALLFLQPWVDARWAFPDPIVAAQSSGQCCSAYFGVISNIGILYWWTAATACACAALVVSVAGGSRRTVAFMACGAALTAVLGLDDLLLLHERIFPALGLPQTLVLLAYAAASLAYLVAFFPLIRHRDFGILAVGLIALGTSLGIDLAFPDQSPGMKIAEDSAKFLGIAGWAGFHTLRAVEVMTDAVRRTGKT